MARNLFIYTADKWWQENKLSKTSNNNCRSIISELMRKTSTDHPHINGDRRVNSHLFHFFDFAVEYWNMSDHIKHEGSPGNGTWLAGTTLSRRMTAWDSLMPMVCAWKIIPQQPEWRIIKLVSLFFLGSDNPSVPIYQHWIQWSPSRSMKHPQGAISNLDNEWKRIKTCRKQPIIFPLVSYRTSFIFRVCRTNTFQIQIQTYKCALDIVCMYHVFGKLVGLLNVLTSPFVTFMDISATDRNTEPGDNWGTPMGARNHTVFHTSKSSDEPVRHHWYMSAPK